MLRCLYCASEEPTSEKTTHQPHSIHTRRTNSVSGSFPNHGDKVNKTVSALPWKQSVSQTISATHSFRSPAQTLFAKLRPEWTCMRQARSGDPGHAHTVSHRNYRTDPSGSFWTRHHRLQTRAGIYLVRNFTHRAHPLFQSITQIHVWLPHTVKRKGIVIHLH